MLIYFYTEFNTQGRRGEMMLQCWVVREHFVFEAYLGKYLSDCLQILHTTLLGVLVVPFGIYEL